MPVVMGAGVAAALVLEGNAETPAAVDVAQLRELLRNEGTVLE